MSSYEEGHPLEQRSSVKISTTAKGDATVEVKAYTHDLAMLDEAREKAVAVYRAAREAVA